MWISRNDDDIRHRRTRTYNLHRGKTEANKTFESKPFLSPARKKINWSIIIKNIKYLSFFFVVVAFSVVFFEHSVQILHLEVLCVMRCMNHHPRDILHSWEEWGKSDWRSHEKCHCIKLILLRLFFSSLKGSESWSECSCDRRTRKSINKSRFSVWSATLPHKTRHFLTLSFSRQTNSLKCFSLEAILFDFHLWAQ